MLLLHMKTLTNIDWKAWKCYIFSHRYKEKINIRVFSVLSKMRSACYSGIIWLSEVFLNFVCNIIGQNVACCSGGFWDLIERGGKTKKRHIFQIKQELLCVLFQEYTPPASAAGLEGTWTASSATDLLQVHVNFLRGKVRLLLLDAQACQQDVSWSADLPTPDEANLCFRRQEKGLDTADLHVGCWKRCGKKGKIQPSSHKRRKLIGKDRTGQDQQGFGWTGDDCTLECRCETWTWWSTHWPKWSLWEALLQ